MASRNEQIIRKALTEKGYEVHRVLYRGRGQEVEMQGHDGGWTIETDDGLVEGLTITDLMDEIKSLPKLY